MAQAARDQNFVTTLLAVSSVDGVTPVTLYANPTTHRLLVDLAGGGSGTVQTISIATANGFAGTSDDDPTNPTLTLSTTVTGILSGNGTAISAASTTGSGAVVLDTSPTLVTPALGTPSSATLTNATGLPLASGVTGQLPLANGGTGANLSDPGADRILFWDDSAGAVTWLTAGTGLTITDTTITATGGGGTPGGSDTQLQYNDNSSFGGITGATTDGTTVTLTRPVIARIDDANGNESVVFTSSASAVNYIDIGNAATGLAPSILATGSDTDVFLYLLGQGTGGVIIASSAYENILATTAVSTAVNWLEIENAATGQDVTISTNGSDTDVDMRLAPKGAGNVVVTTALVPDANDGAALGTTALSFSDLFLASGGVINFNNGNAVITHSSGVITVSTGDLRVTTAGTNTASAVTVGGTQTLTNKTLTSPTITTASLSGAQQLAENASIVLDAALSADGTYSGITVAGTAGATLAFGDLVYLAAADSRWELTDADASATAGPVLVGMCVLAAASDGDPTTILLRGNIRADAAFPSMTISAPLFISTTAGDIQTTAPSGSADIVRIVGHARTADELYFFPSNDYITIT